ncbi:MAG: hypothetical protein KC451_07380 [Amylibacter sp.]|jgi:hypothetical protein|nr:hypothetical protein [Amylibacter sp.]
MFPLGEPTILPLMLLATALFSALVFAISKPQRLACLFAALAIPMVWIWLVPPVGNHAGLVFLVTIGLSITALLVGAAVGIMVYSTGISSRKSVAILIFIAGSVAGYTLWIQFIPTACLEKPLQVRIAGKTLSIPAAMQTYFTIGEKKLHFGNVEKKTQSAQICKMSQNGTQAIDIDTLWIEPSKTYKIMSRACNVETIPVWCKNYRQKPYSSLKKISIKPIVNSAHELSRWTKNKTPTTDPQGDANRGSFCYVPSPGRSPECREWQPFGEDFRLMLEIQHLDPMLMGATMETTREIMHEAGNMTLTILEE